MTKRILTRSLAMIIALLALSTLVFAADTCSGALSTRGAGPRQTQGSQAHP